MHCKKKQEEFPKELFEDFLTKLLMKFLAKLNGNTRKIFLNIIIKGFLEDFVKKLQERFPKEFLENILE